MRVRVRYMQVSRDSGRFVRDTSRTRYRLRSIQISQAGRRKAWAALCFPFGEPQARDCRERRVGCHPGAVGVSVCYRSAFARRVRQPGRRDCCRRRYEVPWPAGSQRYGVEHAVSRGRRLERTYRHIRRSYCTYGLVAASRRNCSSHFERFVTDWPTVTGAEQSALAQVGSEPGGRRTGSTSSPVGLCGAVRKEPLSIAAHTIEL